ncbi:hypothetical protein Vafri_17321, partial [Volvox africanus]
ITVRTGNDECDGAADGDGDGGGGDDGNVVFRTELWPAPCSREWLLKVQQPLGPGAKLQQLKHSVAANMPACTATSNTMSKTSAVTAVSAAAASGGVAAPDVQMQSTTGSTRRRSRNGSKGLCSGSGGGVGGNRIVLGAERRATRAAGVGNDRRRCSSGGGGGVGGGGGGDGGGGGGGDGRGKDPLGPGSREDGGATAFPTPPVPRPPTEVSESDNGCKVANFPHCTHRLYVLAAEGEMRVATAVWHTL